MYPAQPGAVDFGRAPRAEFTPCAVAVGIESTSTAMAAVKLARARVRLLSSCQEPSARDGARQYVS